MVNTRILSRWPLMRSANPVDMLDSLNALYRPSEVRSVQLAAERGQYELRGFAGDGFAIGYIHSDIGVSVAGAAQSSFFVNVGLSGELLSARGDERVRNTRTRAVFFNPGDRQTLLPADVPAETLGIRLSRDLVETELAALIGRDLSTNMRFDFSLDLSSEDAAGLRFLLEDMLRLYDAEHPLTAHPSIRLAQMRSLVAGVLLTHRHSYSETIHSGGNPMRPRTLTRAMSFIEEHLVEPLTLSDIAVAAGCSARTVNNAFQVNMGVSPMTYMRNLRLERTRGLLQTSGLSVSDAAVESGFTHLGRFARAYFERYGELPSETRNRA